MSRLITTTFSVVLLLAVVGCQKPPPVTPATPVTPAPQAANSHPSRPVGVPWFEGDVADAFTAADQQHKPVFVYFGAVWCPPCQELKATMFHRQDFLGKLTLFVPVYLDGDAPDAQRWASEFKVTGYPTMLILDGKRAELERVSGGMDLSRYSEMLDIGLAASRPLTDVLAEVSGASAPLSTGDCRRLAYNGWGLQDEWISSEDHPGWLAATSDALSQAATRCPADAVQERARLQVIAAAAALDADPNAAKPGKPVSPRVRADLAPVRALLVNETLAESVADILSYLDSDFFKTEAKLDRAHVAELEKSWMQLMDAVAADEHYSTTDRLYAVYGKLRAAKALEPGGKLPPALVAEAHQKVDAALALTTDSYTRTSLVNAALNIYDKLDDNDASYALLSGEIKTSKTPYYYMEDLADIEEQRGHKDAALDWLARSYRESEGQATRFQWGSHYVRALIRLRPQDEAAIASTSQQVLGELDGSGRIYGRSSIGLKRLAKSLHDWNNKGKHVAVIEQIHTQMNGICAKVPATDPAQASCADFLKTV
jgi:thiol-disulfide isomerase/thioredoxin